MNMNKTYRHCLMLEKKRESSWRKSRQGRFDASMLSLEYHCETTSEDSDFQQSWESDGGESAEIIIGHCDGTIDDEANIRAKAKRARSMVRYHAPRAMATFNLILKNGSNRNASIREMMKSGLSFSSAKKRYWQNLKKLQKVFSTP